MKRSLIIVLSAVSIVFVFLLMGILPPGMAIFTSVPSGYTGILTTFGEVETTPLSAGFHFIKPWQRVIKMDNHIQTMRIASGTREATTKDTAETKDQQLLPVFEFEIQYQLNAEMSFMVYSNYGVNYSSLLITSNALQYIKETFAKYNADEIVTAKGEIPKEIASRLDAVCSPLGVNIIRVNMVTYDFSPEYTEILEQRALLNAQLENTQLQQQNETIAAQTQYDVAIKEAERNAETQRIASENANAIAIARANTAAETDKIAAENNAYITRAQAEAERDARLAAAEAEKAELEAKSSGLNEYVLQQEFIEKWDGKLMPSFGDVGFGFTNYTDIIGYYLGMGDNSSQEAEVFEFED